MRGLLLFAVPLAACSPGRKENIVDSPVPASENYAETAVAAAPDGQAMPPYDRSQRMPARAIGEPISKPSLTTSAAGLEIKADSPAEARGRKTLSTAFVMIGPDGLLNVELTDGRALTLHKLIMQPKRYCGIILIDGNVGHKYCGSYDEIKAANPGR